jgi:hypothetical protein
MCLMHARTQARTHCSRRREPQHRSTSACSTFCQSWTVCGWRPVVLCVAVRGGVCVCCMSLVVVVAVAVAAAVGEAAVAVVVVAVAAAAAVVVVVVERC